MGAGTSRVSSVTSCHKLINSDLDRVSIDSVQVGTIEHLPIEYARLRPRLRSQWVSSIFC